jgi:hypothetical protein
MALARVDMARLGADVGLEVASDAAAMPDGPLLSTGAVVGRPS